ncbi:MAG: leucine-rich repeat domain-containing protein, partial [Cyanobacteria bacterium J06648_11]
MSVQFPTATVRDATQLVIPDGTTRITVAASSDNSELFPYEFGLELDPSNPSGILPAVPVGAELRIIATAFNDERDNRIPTATGLEISEIGSSDPDSIVLELEEIVVTFEDDALDASVRSALNVSSDDSITVTDALGLTTLNAANSSISDLSGLESFTQLTDIDLSGNAIITVEPFLENNAGLGSGAVVDLTANPLSPEAIQEQIPALEARGVQVEFSPFVTFADSALEAVVRSALGVPDSEPVTEADALTLMTLDASDSSITDLSGLEFFTNLSDLNLSDNAIADISPLVNNVGLGSGDVVNLENNPLEAAALQVQIPTLESRGVQVEFTQFVTFLDSALEAVVRSALGASDSEPITDADALTLTTLDASESGISDLTGLEFFTNLTDLNLSGNDITDIQPLVDNSGFNSGAAIDLTMNPLSITARQIQVPELESRGVQVSVTALVEIDDFNLESAVRASLGLSGSESITVDDAETLTFFSARDESIQDLSGLDSFANLETLDLAENAIADLTPLSALTNLTFLDLSNNDVSDIQPLVDNAGIDSQDFLSLQGNPLSANSLSTLVPELQSRGVTVTTTVQPNVTVVPYLSFENSPFQSFAGSNPNVTYFELETFEGGA